MMLGYVVDGGQALAALAARLEGAGWQLAGAVDVAQVSACTDDMDLRVLGGGPVIRISADLGAGSTGCRLDPGALEGAALAVSRRLPGARAVILNKFGKQEVAGRGFRPVIAEALEAGTPVLIAVSSGFVPAFQGFAGDMAEAVRPEAAGDWLARAAQG